MDRLLRHLGILLMAAAACGALASSAGWLPEHVVDPWIVPAVQAGVLALVTGIVLSATGWLGRMLGRGHCVRCGRQIERGQSYCIDHLRETVAEYRDTERDRAY